MAKTLKIHIFADGRISAATEGIVGKECLKYIPVLEELLEAETVDSAYTEEYYQAKESLHGMLTEQELEGRS
jgi:hypothetical protein